MRRILLAVVALPLVALAGACADGVRADDAFNRQQRSIQCDVMPEDSQAYDDWGCGDL